MSPMISVCYRWNSMTARLSPSYNSKNRPSIYSNTNSKLRLKTFNSVSHLVIPSWRRRWNEPNSITPNYCLLLYWTHRMNNCCTSRIRKYRNPLSSVLHLNCFNRNLSPKHDKSNINHLRFDDY